MSLRLVAGSAHPALAAGVARALGIEPAPGRLERYPDGEIRPTLPELRGDDVYALQSLGAPVAANVIELLLLLDACRRAGAARVTALVPYLAYARQDRREQPGEALGIHVIAEAIAGAGADRIVVVDPHTPALEAMFRIPVETVSAAGALAAAARAGLPRDLVIVAPDLGAVRLAERYAALLDAPVAIVRKTRVSATRVRADQVAGEVAGRMAVIVDDMISTGGTIEAAMRALAAAGAAPRARVIATHAVFAESAAARLAALPIERLIVSDTVPAPATGPPLEVCAISGLLGEVVARLHRDRPLEPAPVTV
ncbi:MAG TPA: ribose-phosphate diphosphokinase [Candidatus Eisenbacteria bacterium]|nr:ribose-phosphate diphosphokinase [Candidatus Eisenbacteria bacterium]